MNLLGKRVKWTAHSGSTVDEYSGVVILDKPPRSHVGNSFSSLPEEVQKVPRRKLSFRPREGWREGLIVRGDNGYYYAPRRNRVVLEEG